MSSLPIFRGFARWTFSQISRFITYQALLFICLSFMSGLAFPVSWQISNPYESPASNDHAWLGVGPVSYLISYTQDAPPLVLLDDPRFFELRDEFDNPVPAAIYVRALSPTIREIKIEAIQAEGIYHLHVFAGSAEDGAGLAVEGDSVPFEADKTPPLLSVTGPFESNLTTPLSEIEMGGTAYYIADFSVDHLAEPFKSRAASDVYNIAATEGVWQSTSYVRMSDLNNSDDEYEVTANFSALRNGDIVIIRASNISGPEIDTGIIVLRGASEDYGLLPSPRTFSTLSYLHDYAGPTVFIDEPLSYLSNGEDIVFDVYYENASVVTLNASDVNVFTTGNVNANISINIISNNFAQVVFTNVQGEGELWFSLDAGTAADIDGDPADAAGPSDHVFVDTIGPKVSFGEPTPIFTVNGPASISIQLLDAVSVSLLPEDIEIHITGTVVVGAVDVFYTAYDAREIVFSDLSGEGTIAISVPGNVAIDQYLQPSVASGLSGLIQVGPLPPMSLQISKPDPSFTISGPVSYELTYQGVASVSLDVSDISFQISGTAYVNTIEISGAGATRIVTLSDIGGEGAVAMVIAAGTAEDPDGNLLVAAVSQVFAVGNNDQDGDEVPDSQEEYIDNTDKNDPEDYLDSDGDVVPDFVEHYIDGTDEHDFYDYLDSDGAYTPDYAEKHRLVSITNEFDEIDDQLDSDGDGLPDYLELVLRLSGEAYDEASEHLPIVNGNQDADLDGVSNAIEYYLSTLLNISNPGFYDDFDRDGYFDHHEIISGLDPRFAKPRLDDDQDGIPNRVEVAAGFDIDATTDQDADGIPDFIEYVYNRARVNIPDSAAIYISNLVPGNPLIDGSSDTDGDGLGDLDELMLGFNPIYLDQPVIWLRFKQNNKTICFADTSSGDVEINLMPGNFQTNITSIDWSASSAALLLAATDNGSVLTFDPSTLTEGVYEINVAVERVHNTLSLVSEYNALLAIKLNPDNRDDDEDGICDSLESSVSSVAERNIISAGLLSTQTDFSVFLHLGYLLGIANAPDSIVIPYSLIESEGNILAPGELDILDYEFGNLMYRHHVLIQNLEQVGASASFIFTFDSPVSEPLPVGSVYRLLTPSGWQDFDITSDKIESSTQSCASPLFQNGLLANAVCIRLTISDGGANDLDGSLNGSISLLGAPAKEGTESVDGTNPYVDFVPGKQEIGVAKAGNMTTMHILCLMLLMLFMPYKRKIL